jgi:hypothetical protein
MARSSSQTWTLHRAEEQIADLVVDGSDFPWLNAQVRPYPGFEEVRPLFVEELRLLDGIDNDIEAWEVAYQQVRATVTLRNPDGRAVPEFLLHIDGDEAWWRWTDEAFDRVPPG